MNPQPRLMIVDRQYAMTEPEVIDRFFNRPEAEVRNQGVRPKAVWPIWVVANALAWGLLFGVGYIVRLGVEAVFAQLHSLTGGVL